MSIFKNIPEEEMTRLNEHLRERELAKGLAEELDLPEEITKRIVDSASEEDLKTMYFYHEPNSDPRDINSSNIISQAVMDNVYNEGYPPYIKEKLDSFSYKR